MKNNGLVELLAPANVDTLVATVQGGADAVYLGGADFGARKNAGNFEGDLLKRAIDYCHLRGVKVYLTLNTIVSDRELEGLANLAAEASAEGIDAFIVQDFGVMNALKQVAYNVPLHASTQMTLHNSAGVDFASKAGFKRAVLARELSKSEISEIIDNTDIEIEIFAHGAICICYSGQCLMSSVIGGRSGNRGCCAQPCRLPYELNKGGKAIANGYILSPKDLSLINQIPHIIDIGVKSIKIEGRMKGPEYVAASVSVFRRCLDEKRVATKEEVELLLNSFSRGGFTGGFFTGETGRTMMRVEKGNDDIYENRNEQLLSQLETIYRQNSNIRRKPVDFTVSAYAGESLKAELNFADIHLSIEGDYVQTAQKKATEKDVVIRQLSKTGEYPYFADNINVLIGDNVFLPVGEINNARRLLLDNLQSKVIQSFKREKSNITPKKYKSNEKSNEFYMAVQISEIKQLEAVLDSGAKYIYIPVEYLDEIDLKNEFVFVFPDIIKNNNLQYYLEKLKKLQNINKIRTGNFAIINKAIELGFEVHGSKGLNIFSSEAANVWKSLGIYASQLSVELNIKGLYKAAQSDIKTTVMAYGNIEMMKIANCPIKAVTGKCDCPESNNYEIKDRKSEIFPIIKEKRNCIATILNSKPVYMADRMDEIKKTGVDGYEIHFTIESPNQCRQILNLYKSGEKCDFPYTRGHFFRGVIKKN